MGWSLRTLPSLSLEQFAQWRKLLEERTGMQLVPQHKALLESQISSRMRELGYDDYDRYYQQVTDGASGMLEWTVIIDRITVKETSFFRHRPSVEYVRHYLQHKINNQSLAQSFDVWSVGCATGEEAYSLAMVISDCFELAALNPYYGITAFDLSVSALATARKGRYAKRKIEAGKAEEFKRYTKQMTDGNYEIASRLRERVCFTQANIINHNSLPGVKVDVIFCQNLLVYFRRWLRRDILNALSDHLKPGGILVTGLGEVTEWEHPKMQRLAVDEVQVYLHE
ncbi:MAG: protein-glutamate O-methyltransferase CheR [Gammaproteobacteria bacterium]|nr:MAG: protein-glutamate O-methyltransferase CheR [Gammaproteobacteria bacterium]